MRRDEDLEGANDLAVRRYARGRSGPANGPQRHRAIGTESMTKSGEGSSAA